MVALLLTALIGPTHPYGATSGRPTSRYLGSAPSVIASLGDHFDESWTASEQFDGVTIYVEPRQETAESIRDAVARSLAGRWRERQRGYVLEPDAGLRQELDLERATVHQSEIEKKIREDKAVLDGLPTALARAEYAARQLWSLQQKLDSGTAAPVEGIFQDLGSPEDVLLMQCVAEIGAQTLSRTPPNSPVVYSLSGGSGRARLPSSIGGAVLSYLDSYQILAALALPDLQRLPIKPELQAALSLQRGTEKELEPLIVTLRTYDRLVVALYVTTSQGVIVGRALARIPLSTWIPREPGQSQTLSKLTMSRSLGTVLDLGRGVDDRRELAQAISLTRKSDLLAPGAEALADSLTSSESLVAVLSDRMIPDLAASTSKVDGEYELDSAQFLMAVNRKGLLQRDTVGSVTVITPALQALDLESRLSESGLAAMLRLSGSHVTVPAWPFIDAIGESGKNVFGNEAFQLYDRALRSVGSRFPTEEAPSNVVRLLARLPGHDDRRLPMSSLTALAHDELASVVITSELQGLRASGQPDALTVAGNVMSHRFWPTASLVRTTQVEAMVRRVGSLRAMGAGELAAVVFGSRFHDFDGEVTLSNLDEALREDTYTALRRDVVELELEMDGVTLESWQACSSPYPVSSEPVRFRDLSTDFREDVLAQLKMMIKGHQRP